MATDIIMPNLGFDSQENRLIEWLKQPGEPVQKGEAIAIVESDKANVELESIASGILLEQLCQVDEIIGVGMVIARIGQPDEASPPPPQPAQSFSEKPTEATPPPVRALPKDRKVAHEAGINLVAVPATDPHGVIQNPPALSATVRRNMLQRMLEIRIAEEQIQELFLQNLIRGTTHLCIGQEACAVGVAWALEKGDMVTCTYRGHGHALAMGMSMKTLMAEMMGKASGACQGKGGSMHMTDASIGLLGANAIVGAQIPIAVGAALTSQVKQQGRVAVTFFGEGTANIGAFHEALNLAAIWQLPIVFICENNLYGEYSAVHKTTPIEDIAVRATAYNMPGIIADGQDVETVYTETKAALERARQGHGPTLLELKTYRYRGHSRTDTAPYRLPGELEKWLQRDPIKLLKTKMIAAGQLDETEFVELEQATTEMVQRVIEWAKAEPFPSLETLYQDIYYEG